MPRDLRTDARELVLAALRAVDPTTLVARALSDPAALEPWSGALARDEAGPPSTPLDSDRAGETLLVAVGKAAPGMAMGARMVLGGHISAGIVVVPDGVPRADLPPEIRVHRAGHPLPDARSLDAAADIRGLLEGTDRHDRVLVLLSGGGSALVTDPEPGLGLDDLRATHEVLLRSGWPITAINDVRRVLDRLKGGGMARLAAPARTLGLVLSDIPGGHLEDVASGPLSLARRSARDVEIALRRDGLFERLPDSVRAFFLRSRGRPLRPVPETRLRAVGSGTGAVEAVARAAAERGYSVQRLGDRLEGEARALGSGLVRAALAARDGVAPVSLPACLVGAGEVTVEVTGEGLGGPNQEVALAGAIALDGHDGIVLVSLGTDGIDGPTPAAGGWVDGTSAATARAAGVDLHAALEDNDSSSALEAIGDRIVTGPTGTNVADVYVVLVDHP